jgi:hypothetical protein
MKRVSITFLPFIPVYIRARVVETPPYTSIKYATAANTEFSKHPLSSIASQSFHEMAGKHITIFLTKPGQHFFTGAGQTVNIPV